VALMPPGMAGILVLVLVVVLAAQQLSPARCQTYFLAAVVRIRQTDVQCPRLHLARRLSCDLFLSAYVSCSSLHLWSLLNKFHTISIFTCLLHVLKKKPRGRVSYDNISPMFTYSAEALKKTTRSSAIADGPHTALCQLKSCQLVCKYKKLAMTFKYTQG